MKQLKRTMDSMNLISRRSKKIGLVPGSYVFLGEQKEEVAQINIMDYNADSYDFKTLESIDEALPYKDSKNITWVNIYGLHDIRILQKIEAHFGIHPLVMEDVLNTSQRPKIEIYDNYIFTVLKMIYFNEKTSELVVEQISLIFYDKFILCFQERKGDFFNPLRERIKKSKGRIRKSGEDYLAYSILDIIIDNYFLVLENFGDQIEVLDEEVTDNPKPEISQKINELKRTLISLPKNIWPLREVIHMLTRNEVPYFKKTTMPFLNDLYDHIIQVIDTTENYREMVTGLMDLYMSGMSHKMNEVMKVLTIIATIFIPLSFLAGIYGMNFDTSISPFNMPELGYRYGYILFWVFAICIGGGLLLFFKKKNWL